MTRQLTHSTPHTRFPPASPLLRRCSLRVLLLTGVLGASVGAQQGTDAVDLPPVSFRTEVTFIEVDAFVTDGDGRPVMDLTVDDFELYEDGQPQRIASFSAVNLPVERRERALVSPRPIEPDVRTNVGVDGRIYLILLDDIHVHPSRVPRVRAALRQFVEHNFGTNDVAAVARVRGSSRDSQDFTSNPQLLLRAIDRFTGNVPREAAVTSPFAEEGIPTPGAASAEELLVAHDARNVSSRLRELSEFLAGVRGRRKAILFVSEGSPFDVHAATGQISAVASAVIEDTQKAIAAATRGNVAIYTIDPRGVIPGADFNDLSASEPPGGFDVPSGVPSLTPIRLAQDSLRELAYETGGFSSVNQNTFEGSFERIVRENSEYYLLGYSPANDAQDGTYRRLEVRVRRPGVRVRARNGYTARTAAVAAGTRPSPGRSPAATAISSPFPTAGIPLSVFAAPYRGSGREALVTLAVEVDASKLGFIEQNGTFHERLELLHTVTDSRGGRRPVVRQELTLALRPETHTQALAGGLRMLSRLELSPGRYQVRVAIGSAITGESGGVLYDLEVPDFTARGLTMSGLALASTSVADAVTIARERVSPLFPTPATTRRVFDPDDTLIVFGELYENARRAAAHTLEIRTELRSEVGQVVRSFTDRRSSTESKESGFGFSAAVPLTGLAPGIYLVHADARSSLDSAASVSRTIQIRIRERERRLAASPSHLHGASARAF
jgi:VWFA-related protein